MKKSPLIKTSLVALAIMISMSIKGETMQARIRAANQERLVLQQQALVVGKLTQLALQPTGDQTTAGQYLYNQDRKDFTLEDLAATVYLQTNDDGQGRLGTLMPEPPLDKIDAAKHLIALPLVPFTQEDLEATLHLWTNPGNVWESAILSPTAEEIEAAKSLRAREIAFTKEQLLQEWQGQVTERVGPLLEELAVASKRLSIIYFNPRFSREKDEAAQTLILGVPESMRESFRAEYERIKQNTQPSEEDLRAGIKIRRELGQRLFEGQ